MKIYRPTKQDLLAAANKTVPDIIGTNLKILFCGINPGLYTAAIGHHFGKPGNRFWQALYLTGFTPRLYSPFEDQKLLNLGFGITNLVSRSTATAAEISNQEFKTGGEILVDKIKKYQPLYTAFVGIGAYKLAFSKDKVKVGHQAGKIENTNVWVLPNTSGLNVNHRLTDFVELFNQLKKAADSE